MDPIEKRVFAFSGFLKHIRMCHNNIYKMRPFGGSGVQGLRRNSEEMKRLDDGIGLCVLVFLAFWSLVFLDVW